MKSIACLKDTMLVEATILKEPIDNLNMCQLSLIFAIVFDRKKPLCLLVLLDLL